MESYRLSREKFADQLSGRGAAISGARWNSVGVELIYSAANRSLAMAEVAVHLTLATLPDDYVMMTLHIPDDLGVQKVNSSDLPLDWHAFPYSLSTQAVGDSFVAANKYCILQVPSAVTQGDFNILINPKHSDFGRVKIVGKQKFPYDHRIFK
jgi:RES domain-containing protein